ncbi:MAG: hypothetical protein Q9208_001954 [Pyrenodesmia sp. 3 TL-2023]
MGDFYHQYYPSTGYQGPEGRAPPYTSYDSYHLGSGHHIDQSSVPTFQKMELTSLQSKMAKMEAEMAQRSKDIAEAQAVIQYLLKLNASASSSQEPIGCCRTKCLAPSENAASLVDREIKDLLSRIVDILHTNLSTVGINKGYSSSFNNCAQVCDGDLLDISDEPLSFETLAVKTTNPLEPLKSLLEEPLHDLQLKPSTLDSAAGSPRQSLAASQGTQTTGPDDFPSQPYVNRFTHAGSQKPRVADCKRAESAGSSHRGGLESSQISFSASSSDLSRSTPCDWSGSASFTSLSSSFSNSEDEAIGDTKRGRKWETREVGYVQEPSGPSSRTTSSEGASVTNVSDIAESVAHKIALEDASVPRRTAALLFMPKWPTKAFAVSVTEREGAISVHKRIAGDQEYQFPDLFRYGTRFRPEPTERDIYRTVLVDNLPSTLRLLTLLHRVKGGPVLDAKLLNTVSLNGKLSAMITFVHEYGANAFVNGTCSRPLVFDTIRARVTLLPTPTYPMSKNLRTAILVHSHTRCLEVQNFPKGIKPAELERELRVYETMTTHRIEAKRMRPDGVLELRFTSIGYAGRAYGILTSRVRYRRCIVRFAPDPCAQPWEEVPEEPVTLHKQAFPAENGSKHEVAVSHPKEAEPDEEDAAASERDHGVPRGDLVDLGKEEDRAGRLTPVTFDDYPKILPHQHPAFDTARGGPHIACKQQ